MEAQNHPWMKVTTIAPTINISPNIISYLQEFQNYNLLRKAALTAVAYHLNNVELGVNVEDRTT